MDTLLYIDNYFTNEIPAEKKREFEKRITEDQEFAEEVAFYLSAKQAAAEQRPEEKNERFKEIYAQYKKSNKSISTQLVIRRLWPYIAAAAIITTIIIGGAVFFGSTSSEQLADDYLSKNLKTLPVTMGIEKDSIQRGLSLYNEEEYNSALQLFENIMQKDTGNYLAKEYVGIVYLKLGNYDKALVYFRQLENYSLFSNPAIFYEALTLMKRNRPGDKKDAKLLLQRVIDNDLEGKKTAQQWWKKL